MARHSTVGGRPLTLTLNHNPHPNPNPSPNPNPNPKLNPNQVRSGSKSGGYQKREVHKAPTDAFNPAYEQARG